MTGNIGLDAIGNMVEDIGKLKICRVFERFKEDDYYNPEFAANETPVSTSDKIRHDIIALNEETLNRLQELKANKDKHMGERGIVAGIIGIAIFLTTGHAIVSFLIFFLAFLTLSLADKSTYASEQCILTATHSYNTLKILKDQNNAAGALPHRATSQNRRGNAASGENAREFRDPAFDQMFEEAGINRDEIPVRENEGVNNGTDSANLENDIVEQDLSPDRLDEQQPSVVNNYNLNILVNR